MIKGPKAYPHGPAGSAGSHARGMVEFDEWGWRSRRLSLTELRNQLDPLLRQLALYDRERTRLETQGGGSALLSRITGLLKRELVIPGRYEDLKLSLADQQHTRRRLLQDFYPHEVRLEVRRRPTGMPVYYLARVWPDYYSEYSLIIEDLYRSPDFPFADDRFVKLMRSGHEVYFLRLSQFRKALRDGCGAGGAADEAVDETLLKVGRQVFQACWHEDQFVGMVAADQFELVKFRRAVELLYLSLTAELCELRSAVNEVVLDFFRKVYVQPAILAFLERLPRLDGTALSEVPQAGLRLFPVLSKAFSRFLALELSWGRKNARLPLYKLLFANFSRLEAVRRPLGAREEIARAAATLEKQSEAVILELLKDSAGLYLDPGAAPAPPATKAA